MWEQHILDLIKASEDAHERAVLSVMLEMARAVRSTSGISEQLTKHEMQFEAHRVEFRKHTEREDELFAEGRGMLKTLGYSAAVVTVLFGALVGLVVWILNGQITSISHNNVIDVDHERRLIMLEQKIERVDELKQELKAHEDQDKRKGG